MTSLNDDVKEYTSQLRKGQIQKAYKGIMTFMSGLRNYLENKYPEYATSALYFGYMDMTYFAFTPLELRKKNLKIAIVYLHEQNKFEIWLGGTNRKVQAAYIDKMRLKDIGDYQLSQVSPGVDSIIEFGIFEQPDFDQGEELIQKIEHNVREFIRNMIFLIDEKDTPSNSSISVID